MEVCYESQTMKGLKQLIQLLPRIRAKGLFHTLNYSTLLFLD